jgi:Ca-activated chloride channel family protein
MFRFAEPTYLYLLLVLPILIALYFYSNRQRKQRIEKYGDAQLLAHLMPSTSMKRLHLKFWLSIAALFILVFVLARPQFGLHKQKLKTKGIEIIIALDISNSMLANDVVPSRLDKAKKIVSRLVDQLDNDKVGLVVFAGDAYTQLPITNDFVSAKMFLETINPSLIRRQGTVIGKALQIATRSFSAKEKVQRAIILITDGENHEEGAIAAAQEAVKKGIRVFVMGVGSTQGSPIPVKPGSNDYRKDSKGQVIITKLNELMCQQLSNAGKGVYTRIDNTNRAEKIIRKKINKMEKSENEAVVYENYNEQFPTLVWIILVLLILEVIVIERKNILFKNFKLFK